MHFWYGSERDSHTIMTSAQHAVPLAETILHTIPLKLILTNRKTKKKKSLSLATYFLLSVKDLEMRHALSCIDVCLATHLLVSLGIVSYVILPYQSHLMIALTHHQFI